MVTILFPLRLFAYAAPKTARLAAVDALPDLKEQHQHISELNAYAKSKLRKIDGIIINSGEDASPYIINIYIPTFMRSQMHTVCVNKSRSTRSCNKSFYFINGKDGAHLVVDVHH